MKQLVKWMRFWLRWSRLTRCPRACCVRCFPQDCDKYLALRPAMEADGLHMYKRGDYVAQKKKSVLHTHPEPPPRVTSSICRLWRAPHSARSLTSALLRGFPCACSLLISILLGYDAYLHKACARIYDSDHKYYIDFDVS